MDVVGLMSVLAVGTVSVLVFVAKAIRISHRAVRCSQMMRVLLPASKTYGRPIPRDVGTTLTPTSGPSDRERDLGPSAGPTAAVVSWVLHIDCELSRFATLRAHL